MIKIIMFIFLGVVIVGCGDDKGGLWSVPERLDLVEKRIKALEYNLTDTARLGPDDYQEEVNTFKMYDALNYQRAAPECCKVVRVDIDHLLWMILDHLGLKVVYVEKDYYKLEAVKKKWVFVK